MGIQRVLKNKIPLILMVFLILQPVIDMVTGVMVHFSLSISLGVVIRVSFLVFLGYYLVFISSSRYRTQSLIIGACILSYLVVFLLSIGGQGSFFLEVSNTLRVFFFPLFFIGLLNIYEEHGDVLKDKVLVLTGFLYVAIIIIANLSGTAFDSYAITKVGSVGWFNSANEVGAIIAILLPLTFAFVFKKISIMKIILLGITVFAILSLGTKIPILALMLCLMVYGIGFLIHLIKTKKWAYVGSLLVLILGLCAAAIYLIPKTPLYKNMVIHAEFLKLGSVWEMFKDGQTIDHLFFGSRISFFMDNLKVYLEGDVTTKLLGMGYGLYEKKVEMDLFDIILRHGVLGAIGYFGGVIYLSVLYVAKGLKRLNWEYVLPLVIGLGVSFISGHVLTAPSVSIIVAFILLKFLTGKRQE